MDDKVLQFARRAEAALKRFHEDLADAKAVQHRLLFDECIGRNVDTAFGREHGFSGIRTVDDYRAAVPIRSYDELAPYIERAAAGERAVLTAEDPVAFNRTSGTTGASKKIPVTRSFQRDHEERRKFTNGGALLAQHPELLARTDSTLSFVWDPKPKKPTAGGAEHVALTARLSTAGAAWEGMPGTLAPWSSIPADVSPDRERSYYRLRLAVEHDLLAFVAVNPSTLVAFAQLIAESMPRLIAEVAAGTVLGKPLGAPNPDRARSLEALASRHHPVLPAHLWPNTRVIACWTGGSCALYLPQVRAAYGAQARIAPAGSICSEGPVTCPADDHPVGHPLQVGSVFFEFLPQGGSGDRTLLYDELEENRSYELIMTQPCGLYRYAIGDVFKVVGFYGDVPRLEFVGRKGVYSSFTGEKLTETQVTQTMQAALETTGLPVSHITCCPLWGDVPRYCFVVETTAPCAPGELERLASELERQLGLHNDEYPGKRSSSRLAPVCVDLVAAGTFDRYRAQLIAAGRSAVQLKHKALHGDKLAHAELLRLSDRPAIRAEAT